MQCKACIELIKITYWSNHSHCGSDFDPVLCMGGDNGPCDNYDFCKQVDKINRAMLQKVEG